MIKVTVITATWNSEATIADTLKSLASQSYSNIEYLVIDGASKDGTLDIVKEQGDRVSKLVSEQDKGIYDALNKGIAMATGDVIGFLHSDDLFADADVVSKIAQAFEDSSVDAVYGDLDYVSKENTERVIRRWVSGHYNRKNIRNGWMPPHPSFYMRRAHYQRLGGFDLNYRIAADYDSILRYLWTNKLSAKYIPKVFIKMRVGGESNRSLRNILRKTQEDKKAMHANELPFMRALLGKNFSKIPQFFKR
ncbi:glycosyltransferase family 2 protein [Vibrio sp. 1262-1]|uniref:glycosyltransferase family 2 protein n=1 Tax=Vibrio sp. 1262-1 TaxID=3074548 RepID=UPI00296551B2|nr:glycosyltransferase family 2 protein [Vibrio sp. 1262-1]MDW2402521.1 glycosyltransferase family 2 protein [Vibrio sp. 1262-1]